jgi:hypothetical protein
MCIDNGLCDAVLGQKDIFKGFENCLVQRIDEIEGNMSDIGMASDERY